MKIGLLLRLVEIILYIFLTVKYRNGLHLTTQLNKILLLSVNNLQQDYGQVTNVQVKNSIQRLIKLIFTIMINILNRSQLIQVTLLALLAMEVKFFSWTIFNLVLTTWLSGTTVMNLMLVMVSGTWEHLPSSNKLFSQKDQTHMSELLIKVYIVIDVFKKIYLTICTLRSNSI